MKIVVVGGTGLIGSKVVRQLSERGHGVVPASPSTGVDLISGVGVDAAFEGADVVVDVSQSPTFEDAAMLEFFTTSTWNQLMAEAAHGVGHHVALSSVNCERFPANSYLSAKAAQERLIREAGVPYSIVRSTQFFEVSTAIAQGAMVDGWVRLPAVRYQPIAADDVARAMRRVAAGHPLNGTLNIAGPKQYRLNEFIFQAQLDRGEFDDVIGDPRARYFGTELEEHSLIPDSEAELGCISYENWLIAQKSKRVPERPRRAPRPLVSERHEVRQR